MDYGPIEDNHPVRVYLLQQKAKTAQEVIWDWARVGNGIRLNFY